ncbi:MAG: PA2778 family cysteine peptidase [Gammaproteobacteria bacterium]
MRRISSPSFTRSSNHTLHRLLNTRFQAGVLLSGLLLTGCATAPQTRQLTAARPTGLPVAHELEQVPFFPQTRYQCGPAALATVLATYGVDVSPDTLVDQVYVPRLKGSLPEEITASARRHGMLAYPLAPALTALLSEIAEGHPVLVFQNLGLRWLPKRHFAVVVGYDLEAGELVLRSGTLRRRRTPLAVFERTWARLQRRAWVILPPGEVPASAELLPYLRAAHELERSDNPATARAAWRAGTRAWPDSFRAWIALGNSHYAAREFSQAGAAFRRATRLAPDKPAAWNNLAYALLKTRCPQQARVAADCALKLAPDDTQARHTAEEIDGLATGSDAPHCLAVTCSTPSTTETPAGKP